MLRGRDAERAELDRLVEGTDDGRSGALLIRGEAGAGKTALLDYVGERSGDRRRLRGRGRPTETRLPFAALHQLLLPAHGMIERLPIPQRGALAGAFGLDGRRPDDPFLIGVAVLTLLSEFGEGSGLICLIDDAHWLDQPSRDALIFASRRLNAEGLALVIAVREAGAEPWHLAGLAELSLRPLDSVSATAVIIDLRPGVASPVRDKIVEQAAGNPLALVEFQRQLSDDQVTGRLAMNEPLTIDVGVEHLFARRTDQLPVDARRLLLLAAADDSGSLAGVATAAAALGLSLSALDPAEQAGLVRVSGQSLEFVHPLVRSAVYQHATSASRREAHLALGAALGSTGDHNADRVAWHFAAAAVTADEEVASALEASAERALARGGTGAAVAALERAAALTSDESRRGGRWLRAAELAWQAGYASQVATLLDQAEQLLEDPSSTAVTLYLRGLVALRRGRPDQGFVTLLESFRTGVTANPRVAVDALVAAGEAASYTGDAVQIAQVRDLALSAHPTDPALQLSLSLLSEGAGMLAGEVEPASLRLGEVLRGTAGFADPQQIMWAGRAALYLGDDIAAHALYTRAVNHARSVGAVGLLAPLLGRLGFCDFLAGRFADAAAHATEAVALGRDVGQDVSYQLVCLALVEGARGEDSNCRNHAAEVLAATQPRRVEVLTTAADWALGLLELGHGRPEQALDRLAGANGHAHPAIRRWSSPDVVEAAVRAGREDIAQEVLAEFEKWASISPLPLVAATRMRCRGLLASADAAIAAYRDALSRRASTSHAFHDARTQLLLGEALRRNRQRSAARAPLRAALQTFERLGATPWFERAATELRATGEATSTTTPGAPTLLTSQELRIARLASEGLSNRDIAAQLFLSPRTVEYHLRKTFTKLQVTSRTELMRMDLEQ